MAFFDGIVLPGTIVSAEIRLRLALTALVEIFF